MRNVAKPAVLSVGRLYCDLIFTDLPRLPTLGTEVFGAGFSVHPGGGAFITAAHLSELGHASSLASMLPSSPFAELVSGDLQASRIDLSLSGTLPASSGPQITVAMVEGGDRAFLTRRAGPALPKLSAAELAKHDFQHLHVGELASLLAEPGIIALARKMGMTISVD
ncbi:MAG: carbohydrate kinase family protein, partial [Pseudomonadota bacterium]